MLMVAQLRRLAVIDTCDPLSCYCLVIFGSVRLPVGGEMVAIVERGVLDSVF